ncbi:MAG TPA: acetyl-CoA carboxylase biotin carboxylase subunit [Phycisphaerae bacterium]|nr:acetyl-CoA carboxylase biotin carboxylase subunit [Phycisphaerae bacterium]HRW51684.1 acetyl-CoA carboxylase biotin carboxylase subunit [Phycisphaerae bacterium]
MFKKILIANRGEIAVRIMRTCQELGIRAVAVYSDPDRRSVHVGAADEAYALDGVTSGETYLRADKIVAIARRCGADAIHPGFGFLSENAAFAEACADAGITFIGPRPDAIRAMGDKIIAKETLSKAGVPIVPGFTVDVGQHGAALVDQLKSRCAEIGYPVLIKAAAGGGGKGMRVVNSESEMAAALEAAQREANAAFGDARVFVEKYLSKSRHVEIQVFGDTHGNVVHLFERECSIQRRHQKIVEESPSVALTPELRERMGAAAVAAARAIGYVNAGTVEFMVDDAGAFYFLEVNTRLQVEHPVTELVTRRDLVKAQLLVAAGEPLPFTQADLKQEGHAMEVRVYAEDAARGFLPSTGTVGVYREPVAPNVRVDSGIDAGSEVSVHYDPMLAKLIVWGRDRQEAIARMEWALRHYVILGVTTNIDFLRAVVSHPKHVAGEVHTRFLDENPIDMTDGASPPDEAWIAAVLAAHSGGPRKAGAELAGAEAGPWRMAGAWKAY